MLHGVAGDRAPGPYGTLARPWARRAHRTLFFTLGQYELDILGWQRRYLCYAIFFDQLTITILSNTVLNFVFVFFIIHRKLIRFKTSLIARNNEHFELVITIVHNFVFVFSWALRARGPAAAPSCIISLSGLKPHLLLMHDWIGNLISIQHWS